MGNKAKFMGAVLALVLTNTASGQEIITGADVDAVLNAARGYGSASLASQPNGDPLINGRIEGLGYQVFFRNCTENARCEDINFYVGFLNTKPTLQVINDWNLSKRFSRAYLDQDQDACVEMDLDLVQGVSPAYLDSQMAIWNMVVQQFADHVGFKSTPPS
jgi:hypothetical protein